MMIFLSPPPLGEGQGEGPINFIHDQFGYNPPTTHQVFTLTRAIPWNVCRQEIALQCGLADDAVAHMLWHGGVHMNGVRLHTEPHASTIIPENTKFDCYRFVREPVPVPFGNAQILFQDATLIAINKPAWLPVQGSRVSMRVSLETRVREWLHIPTLQAAHRLDRETSGVTLFGVDGPATGKIMREFAKGEVEKNYHAIVAVDAAPPHQLLAPGATWRVEGYLQRDWRALPANRFRLLRDQAPRSKWSASGFTLLHYIDVGASAVEDNVDAPYIKDAQALIACRLETGRTHQLRVHLASCHMPILGDLLYGWRSKSPEKPRPRIQLHAESMRITHPLTRAPLHFIAPPPPDFLLESPHISR